MYQPVFIHTLWLNVILSMVYPQFVLNNTHHQTHNHSTVTNQQNPTSGLLSILHSDWLSYSQAILTSSKKHGLFGRKKGLKSSFNQLKSFILHILTSYFDLTKTIFLLPSWPLSQQPMRPKAEWAIDSEPIRALRIIDK